MPAGRWTPGQPSPNPRGRPRGQTLSAELRRLGNAEAIATRLINLIGDPQTSTRDLLQAIQLYADRVEGKAISRQVRLQATASAVLPAGFFELEGAARERVIANIRSKAIAGELALAEGDNDE